MGFLEPKPQPHKCAKPSERQHPAGTRWQCDDCETIYCLEMGVQYNETFKYWHREPKITYKV